MAVAQLVESRIVIPVVVGSNPISHPIRPQEDLAFLFLRGLCDGAWLLLPVAHWRSGRARSREQALENGYRLAFGRIWFAGTISACPGLRVTTAL